MNPRTERRALTGTSKLLSPLASMRATRAPECPQARKRCFKVAPTEHCRFHAPWLPRQRFQPIVHRDVLDWNDLKDWSETAWPEHQEVPKLAGPWQRREITAACGSCPSFSTYHPLSNLARALQPFCAANSSRVPGQDRVFMSATVLPRCCHKMCRPSG